MTVTLRTNTTALGAISELNRSSAKLQTSFTRLSTGLRINTPSDDPAGLSVAGKIAAQSTILGRGQLNINDGISLINVADGALREVSSLLTRLSELAAQAANGVFSKSQRQALQKEFSALDQEIRRIADTTKFNGISLFDSGPNSKGPELLTEETTPVLDPFGRFIGFKNLIDPTIISTYDIETGNKYYLDPETVKAGGSGSIVTFTSEGKAIIQVSDAGSKDLYYYDPVTGSIEQITNSQNAVDGTGLRFSEDESTILFTARTIYADGGTAASASGTYASARLYALDVESGIIRTNGEALSTHSIYLSPDGTQIGHFSGANVYHAELTASGMSSLNLITSTAGANYLGITNEGNLHASSISDLAGTGNALNNVFLLDKDTGSFSQITDVSVSTFYTNFRASADGTYALFTSTSNITGENSSGNQQIFRMNILSGEIDQLTQYTSPVFFVGTTYDRTTGIGESGGHLARFDLTPDPLEYDLEIGYGAKGRIVAELSAIGGTLAGLGGLLITSQKSAQRALGTLSENIELLGQIQGQLGAASSRLQSASSVLASQKEALLGAKSRIEDADIAQESASIVSNSIRQNATTALLAQANQQVGVSLRLLRQSGIAR